MRAVIATVIGLPAGIIAGVNRGSSFDHALMSLSLTGFSMPIFWWGLLLIILFSGILHWTPVSGRIDVLYFFPPVTGFMLIDSLLSGQDGAFTSAVRHLILPAIVLGTIPMAVIARQTRSAMLEVLNEDYVRTARAKGLPPSRVIGLHALRNALIPVVTVIGLQVSVAFGGAILTETIFSWPGIGKWLVDSIARRDYPALQGGVLLIATHRHAGQSAGRPVLRHHQSAHPAREVSHGGAAPRPSCRGRESAARAAARVLVLLQREQGRGRRPRGDRAGRVLGGFADVIAPHEPFRQFRDHFLTPPLWQEGGSASSCSAPTRSAATSSRASSTARATRC